MNKLIPALVLAGLLPMGGCSTAPVMFNPYAPYAASAGAWAHYDPYYEIGYYRGSSQPIAYYGPYDAPYGHTYYGGP